MAVVFLDLETDYDRHPLVVGILDDAGVHQFVAPNIDREEVLALLPVRGRLVTFNGGSFDVPIIINEYGGAMGLRLSTMDHIDLLSVARRAGLAGQLRATEVRIGFQATKREEGHVYARWRAWIERGDRGSLNDILKHNREDLEGTAALYRRLLVLRYIAPRFG